MAKTPSPLEALCAEKGVRIESLCVRRPTNRNAKGDDWKASAYEFACVLSYAGRTMQVPYFMGHGHESYPFISGIDKGDRSTFAKGQRIARAIPPTPSAADVLSSLILDSSACDMTFDDWCSDYGNHSDSIKARDTYHECQRIGSQVRKLLGADFATFQNVEH